MIIAVDIGGTKIAAARVDASGILAGDAVEAPTPADEGPSRVVAVAVGLVEHLRTSDDVAVGVSTAGVVDASRGTIIGATNSIRGWAGTDLAHLMRVASGLPVWVLGDGNAFGVGLAAEYGVSSLVALIAGTGIGGSVVVDGEPRLGAHHAGGHVGHLPCAQAEGMPCPCGRVGHLEAVASGYGILAFYRSHGGDPSVASTRKLTHRAADPVAALALTTGGGALGAAASGLANVLDPELVVIAGSVAGAGDPWEAAVREAYAANLVPALADTPLSVSGHDGAVALRGVAAYARRRMRA